MQSDCLLSWTAHHLDVMPATQLRFKVGCRAFHSLPYTTYSFNACQMHRAYKD
jgi:hypothetical protein